MKQCCICKEFKDESEFYVSKGKINAACKVCYNIRGQRYNEAYPNRNKENCRKYYSAHREEMRESCRQWRKKNPTYGSNKLLLHKYGITLAEKEKMIADQENRCAACGSADPKDKRGWHLDHNHATNEIRAILCRSCNSALGFAEESIERLESLIVYLKKFQKREIA